MRGLEADLKAEQEQLKQLQANRNLHAALRLSAQQAQQVWLHDCTPNIDIQLTSIAPILFLTVASVLQTDS